MIPYGRQDITQDDIDMVVSVLRSDFLTQGPVVPKFEGIVANYCGSKHALAVNSATAALHIACLALDLKPGDWLWTSPITFVASANCGLYCGANIDFVDIDSETYNICPIALERKLIAANANGSLPKLIVAVHLSGQACDMAAIHELSQRFGFKIIEDASHAIGGKYKGDFIGNNRYCDITVFSFHPVKIITTAEGGMVLTNNDKLASRMALFRSHGITRDVNQMTHISDGPWYYQQVELGFNYRMSDMQAALGVSQMSRLNHYVDLRQKLANRYDEMLSNLPVIRPWHHPDSHSSTHLYIIRLQLDQIKRSHREVFNSMQELGVGVNVHYIPVHTQPYYQSMGFRPGDYPKAEKYYAEAITLPIFPTMTNIQQDSVVSALIAALY